MASFTLSFYLLFLLLPLSAVFAQISRNLTVGASLTASENSSSWLSPSGDFAFGFKKLETNNDQFLLSIWYDKIPEKTIVWYANGDSPAPSGSIVELSATRGLALTDPQGKELWRSETIIGTVASAAMTDSGNFVIQDGSFIRLWESFKDPADTILPSQTLQKGVKVSSRQSDTNFSKGKFIFLLRDNLVLTTINLPSSYANEPYYRSGTAGDSNTSSPGKELVFNESGYLNILRENSQLLPLTGVIASTGDFYHRATLHFDGVFTQYYRPKNGGNQGWTAFWSIPDDICKSSMVTAGSGTCGLNSVCRLNAEKRPICECPRGYSLLDPNDRYGSCKPNYTQSCGEDEEGPVEDLYGFEELANTRWPTSDYALLKPFTEEQCKESCLQDCMCAVATFHSGDECWKKKLPLSNGKVDPTMNGKALLKVRKGNANPRIPYLSKPELEKQIKDRAGLILAGSVLLGCSFFVNILLVTAICLGFFFICKKKTEKIRDLEGNVPTNLCCFTYKELEEATDGFKEEIGRGSFGVVYKGCLQKQISHTIVAVKKLHSSMLQDGLKEFKTEVNVIGQIHHKNLVRLVGFCDEGEQHLLVYELLSNGTLSSFLFGDLKPSWNKRIEIAFGIARGLLYLHEECSTQIIHCDIKPQNILLDENYNARISDFGLAKLLLLGRSQTHTAIRGTKGYVAPEWFRNLPITVKVDVYSFGVVLLEIICCRRSVDSEKSLEERAILTDWAYDCFCEGTLDPLVGFDMEAVEDKARLERFVMVAIWCIQEDPSVRPNVRQVTQMLEGIVEVPVPPCPFPFNVTFTEMSLPSLQPH